MQQSKEKWKFHMIHWASESFSEFHYRAFKKFKIPSKKKSKLLSCA